VKPNQSMSLKLLSWNGKMPWEEGFWQDDSEEDEEEGSFYFSDRTQARRRRNRRLIRHEISIPVNSFDSPSMSILGGLPHSGEFGVIPSFLQHILPPGQDFSGAHISIESILPSGE